MYLDRIINEPGEGNGNPLQHSCQDNSMDRGAWQATAHGVAKSWTRLKQLNTHIKFNENLVIRAKLNTYGILLKTYFCLCCSVTKSCPTLCRNCSTPGLTISHYLPEFAQVHVH